MRAHPNSRPSENGNASPTTADAQHRRAILAGAQVGEIEFQADLEHQQDQPDLAENGHRFRRRGAKHVVEDVRQQQSEQRRSENQTRDDLADNSRDCDSRTAISPASRAAITMTESCSSVKNSSSSVWCTVDCMRSFPHSGEARRPVHDCRCRALAEHNIGRQSPARVPQTISGGSSEKRVGYGRQRRDRIVDLPRSGGTRTAGDRARQPAGSKKRSGLRRNCRPAGAIGAGRRLRCDRSCGRSPRAGPAR